MALVVAGLVVCPRTYKSEAKLFVCVGRESISLDPTATTGQIISVYDSRESEIASVMDVLGSRVILEKVVATIGTAEILNGQSDTPKNREKAIRALEQSMSIARSKKSCVLSVTAKAKSPKLAQNITQTFVDAFHEEHLRVNRTVGSHQFFVDQSKVLEAQLADAHQKLRHAKNEIGLVSIEGRRRLG